MAEVAPGVRVFSVRCPYCGRPAVHRHSSAHIYRGRDYGPVWQCLECDAYVGCHPDGAPLGRLADKELRQAKMAVHSVFDPLWQDVEGAYGDGVVMSNRIKKAMRGRAYEWLAHHLGITKDECHVGMFDVPTCAKAIAVITNHKPTSGAIRDWAKAAARRGSNHGT
jgi:hypothetical protein